MVLNWSKPSTVCASVVPKPALRHPVPSLGSWPEGAVWILHRRAEPAQTALSETILRRFSCNKIRLLLKVPVEILALLWAAASLTAFSQVWRSETNSWKRQQLLRLRATAGTPPWHLISSSGMNSGDFEWGARGIQLCSVWLQVYLPFQVSDTRCEKTWRSKTVTWVTKLVPENTWHWRPLNSEAWFFFFPLSS